MDEPEPEFWYWCSVTEAWVRCTKDEYYSKHFGKSFTKVIS